MAKETDGAAPAGILAALAISLALGWGYDSLIVGAGAFVAGSLIAVLWGRHAGEARRERLMREGREGGGGG